MAETAFDPDKYIKEKGIKVPGQGVQSDAQSGFDPDKYIQEKGIQVDASPEPSFLGMTKSGLIHGSLNALPVVGSMTGGILGGLGAGPAGAMGGAALGGAGGEAFKQLGEKAIYGEGPKTSTEAATEIAKQGLLGSTAEAGGQLLGAGLKAASPAVSKFGYKLGSAISGVPEKAIQTFKKAPEAIEDLYKSNEGNLPMMSDQVKATANKAIQETKQSLNKQIEYGLHNSNADIPIDKPIAELEAVWKKLDPKVPSDLKQMEQISTLKNQLLDAAEGGGTIPIQTANRFKQSLQDQASQSYAKPGEVYSLGSDSARAAKGAASSLRESIGAAEPSVAEANAVHERLHNLDDMMHQNLLGVGKPEAALTAGGSGANQRTENILKGLSEITGKDILGDAQKLSASQYFGNPSFIPAGAQTGVQASRKGLGGAIGAATGAGIGHLAGGNVGMATGGLMGKYAGEVMSSPATIAQAVKMINAGQKVSPEVMQIVHNLSSRGLINMGQRLINMSQPDQGAR